MAKAVLRRFRQSPRKVRMVADMIRGRRVDDALSILKFQQRKAAKMLSKVLTSAIANATENESADADRLVVTRVAIDPGPVEKRWLARSMGRANRINRRSSHVTVEVDTQEEVS
jgi:large subunit ribosomal protein L22